MEAMRERWTDDRLDDLNGKVDVLRVEMRTEFAAVRGEMDRRFDKVDERFDKVDERFDKVDERFEQMNERLERMNGRLVDIYRVMLGFCGSAMAALIGFIATQV
jgi:archaellum component FlaC